MQVARTMHQHSVELEMNIGVRCDMRYLSKPVVRYYCITAPLSSLRRTKVSALKKTVIRQAYSFSIITLRSGPVTLMRVKALSNYFHASNDLMRTDRIH